MTLDLVCNFRKCRKPLTSQAWVTTCSHAFCLEHGKREFKRNEENVMSCPACGTELRDKFDVIQADLNPNETFKSIVLAGMKPDVIMDVAMRAMSFWSYQVEQETLYHESLAKHSREKLQSMEEMNTIELQKTKSELETCKRKIMSLQEEFNKKSRYAEDLAANLEEKTRRIQKLTFQLNHLSRKDIRSDNFESTIENNNMQEKCMDISDLVRSKTVIGTKSTSEAFVFRPAKESGGCHRLCSPRTPMFDLRNTTKQTEESHFHFRPISS